MLAVYHQAVKLDQADWWERPEVRDQRPEASKDERSRLEVRETGCRGGMSNEGMTNHQ